MTLTPDLPEPSQEGGTSRYISEKSRLRTALSSLGIAAATGTTAMVATIIWPVAVVPVSIFIAAATLAVESIRIVGD